MLQSIQHPACRLFSVVQRPIICDPSQIILYISVQNQIGIGEGIIVNQIVQL